MKINTVCKKLKALLKIYGNFFDFGVDYCINWERHSKVFVFFSFVSIQSRIKRSRMSYDVAIYMDISPSYSCH